MTSSVIMRSLIIKAISSTLTSICKDNSKHCDNNNKSINPFLSKKANFISIRSFIDFLVNDTTIEVSTLITTLILIDRLCAKNNFRLNYYNIHKIIIATLILAIKLVHDDTINLEIITKLKGISIQDLNLLEYECFTLLEFSLYISDVEYLKYYDYLNKVINATNS